MIFLTPVDGMAQGFGVFEQSGCVQGRAGATVAKSCSDGSGMFFNPAGIAGLPGWTISGGLTTVTANGSWNGDNGHTSDLANDTIPLPHIYVNYGAEKLAFGVGMYVPYGLKTQWPLDFEGRFYSYDSGLHSVYIQPTVAYKPNENFSIGGGLVIVQGSVELRRRLDLAELAVTGTPFTFGQIGIPPMTDFADLELDADGASGVGANLGFQAKLHERFSIGARYMTEIKLDFEGEARFEQIETGILLPPGNPLGMPPGTPLDMVLTGSGLFDGGPLTTQPANTTLDMPAQFVVGIHTLATEKLGLFFDYQWTGWSTFDEIVLDFTNPTTPQEIIVQNYENTSGIRFGVEYEASEKFVLQGGYIYNQAAAPDETVTPLLPEASRNNLTLGVGLRPSPAFELWVSYQRLLQKDRDGRIVAPPPGQPPTTDLNSGVFSFDGHLFGITASVHF
jgi:long-chain fatty acid transport protein